MEEGSGIENITTDDKLDPGGLQVERYNYKNHTS